MLAVVAVVFVALSILWNGRQEDDPGLPEVSKLPSIASSLPTKSEDPEPPQPKMAEGQALAQPVRVKEQPAEVFGTKARAKVDQFPAERAAIMAKLEKQSIEETIDDALSLWPADAFTLGASRGIHLQERLAFLLQDPRLARILYVAVHGTTEEREVIRDRIVANIEDILQARRSRDEGLPYDEIIAGSSPGREIYPLVLAEVDTNGETLPILLRWYESERGPDWTEGELQALAERIEGLGAQPSTIDGVIAGDMISIAAAARRITDRLGEPMYEEDDSMAINGGGELFPGGRMEIPYVDELEGYPLLQFLTPTQCDQVMGVLRSRLNTGADNRPPASSHPLTAT